MTFSQPNRMFSNFAASDANTNGLQNPSKENAANLQPVKSNTQNLQQQSEKVENISVRWLSQLNFKKFAGNKGEDLNSFLMQMAPYEKSWCEQEAFSHVENNLKGKALCWFRGSKNRYFKNWAEFKDAFRKMFAAKNISKADEFFIKISNTRLKIGKLEEELLKIFEIYQDILSLQSVITIVGQNLPSSILKKLKEYDDWMKILEAAREMDELELENAKNRKTEQKNLKANSVKSEIRCLDCNGPHHKNECSKIESEASVSNSEMTIDNSKENSRISLKVKGREINVVLDSSISENLISETLEKEFKLEVKFQGQTLNLGQVSLQASRSIQLFLRAENDRLEKELKFLVIPGLVEDMILGATSLKELKANNILNNKDLKILGRDRSNLYM